MPREEAHLASGYPRRGHGHSYITAEEAAGIGILIVILGISLLIGCWYCRWRRGYQRLKVGTVFRAAGSPAAPAPSSSESSRDEDNILSIASSSDLAAAEFLEIVFLAPLPVSLPSMHSCFCGSTHHEPECWVTRCAEC
ncbi:melanoma antigen recognized by T-cells 1 isoform X1 [Sorex araneus]|uniref:melanoma antigen recognized by T-cells 1 isoform X1 n=1 Tax=Sorex araneus TaxID=42254 RepID=UPI002433FAA1|nr:melanoma antigen recognized by T-cells 1 isoform X1 [Sorex araneus]XP_054979649.1 melanoma antigen recognized by T-cells 1 isoform X1 [Sorex araneus]